MARCQEIGQKEKIGLSVEEQRKGKNAPKERYVNIACVLQLAI